MPVSPKAASTKVSHQEITAPTVNKKPKPGSSTATKAGLKNATTAASRGYMIAVAATMPGDNSGRTFASRCLLASKTVVCGRRIGAAERCRQERTPLFTGR